MTRHGYAHYLIKEINLNPFLQLKNKPKLNYHTRTQQKKRAEVIHRHAEAKNSLPDGS
jgi:hypothetical protein